MEKLIIANIIYMIVLSSFIFIGVCFWLLWITWKHSCRRCTVFGSRHEENETELQNMPAIDRNTDQERAQEEIPIPPASLNIP